MYKEFNLVCEPNHLPPTHHALLLRNVTSEFRTTDNIPFLTRVDNCYRTLFDKGGQLVPCHFLTGWTTGTMPFLTGVDNLYHAIFDRGGQLVPYHVWQGGQLVPCPFWQGWTTGTMPFFDRVDNWYHTIFDCVNNWYQLVLTGCQLSTLAKLDGTSCTPWQTSSTSYLPWQN